MDLGWTCSFICNGNPRHYDRVHRAVKTDPDWVLGLGMHNFRSLERFGTFNRRAAEKKERRVVAGCVADGRRRQRRRKNSRKFCNRGRWSTDRPCNVSKSKKAIEKSRNRSTLSRQIGRDRRGSKMKRNPIARKTAEVLNVDGRKSRKQRRIEWLYKASYLKLSLQYRTLCPNALSTFCSMSRNLGARKAYHSINHWKCKSARKVLKIVQVREVEEEKRLREAKLKKVETPKPERRNFRNFRSWAEAVHRWMPVKVLCPHHAKAKYAKYYDEDKGLWSCKYRYCPPLYPEFNIRELTEDFHCPVRDCDFVIKAPGS